jgi:hypothetical protein
VTDLPTLERWIAQLGYRSTVASPTALRLHPPADVGPLPPFFVEWSPNWVVLSLQPVIAPGEYRLEDLGRRLLAANPEMRLAKFALDERRAAVLTAELPTESLDFSEIEHAIERLAHYAKKYRAELLGK